MCPATNVTMQQTLTGSIGVEAASRCGAVSKICRYLTLGLNPAKLPQPAPFQNQGFLTTTVSASFTTNSAQPTGATNTNARSGALRQNYNGLIAISFGLLYLFL